MDNFTLLRLAFSTVTLQTRTERYVEDQPPKSTKEGLVFVAKERPRR